MSYSVDPQALARAHFQEGLKRGQDSAQQQAVIHLETAIALGSRDAETYFQLARMQAQLQNFGQAESAARAVLDIESAHAGACHLLGTLLVQNQQYAEALGLLEKAALLSPQSAQVRRDRAAVEMFLGRIDSARTHFIEVLKLDLEIDDVLFTAVNITDMGDGSQQADWLFQALLRLAARTDALSDNGQIQMCYSLAKAYEDRGDEPAAFTWMQKGAAAKRATLAYDGGAHVARLKRVAEIFSPALLSRLAGQGLADDRPIFIVGMPRSGTTLVEQIVSAHPDVYGAGEIIQLMKLVGAARGRQGEVFPDWAATMNDQDCVTIGQHYLDSLPHADEPRLTDKRLENFEYLGLVHLCLPNAPILHVRRDPRDVALSCYGVLFATGQEWSYAFEDLARFWRAQEALMTHWKAVLPPGRILEISYEELVADFEPQTRRIIQHCGLNWDPNCLDFHKSPGAVTSASAAQVRRPLYDTAIGRWRRYAEQMAPLYKAMELREPVLKSSTPRAGTRIGDENKSGVKQPL